MNDRWTGTIVGSFMTGCMITTLFATGEIPVAAFVVICCGVFAIGLILDWLEGNK